MMSLRRMLSPRQWRSWLATLVSLDESPWRMALALAVGVFISFTPFLGFQTLLAFLIATVARLNLALTIAGTWLNLPWFAPFVYAFCFRLGEAVLTGDWSSFSPASIHGLAAYLRVSPRETAGTLYQMVWDMLFVASMPLFVGTTLVGLVLAVAAYFITLEAVRDVRRLRARMHPAHEPAGGSPRPTERTP
jgi:uncharacterized protein (DUF2062 family)